jgi:DNA-binding CsgD family transcriptional regulator
MSQECPKPHAARLTPRQLEVLALLCEGLPNKLIARRLNIATGTVKIHVSGILRELGVATRMQAVLAAGRYELFAKVAAEAPKQAAGTTAEDQPVMAARSSQRHPSRRIAMVVA